MKIVIDNLVCEAEHGATILDAAAAVGIPIPTLCHVRGLEPCTSCFVCVVKVEGREALVPACATKVTDGMVVHSETPEVHAARRTALELLLSDHAGECMAPCQLGCPAGLDIPRMLRGLAAGRDAEAAAIVKERIALPSVLGRVCAAPCEKACRRKHVDSPVAICRLKATVGDAALAGVGSFTAGAASGRKVAVVGAGPAGLTAAWFLRRRGHACVLLEADLAAGGGLRQVEAARLPADVLSAEMATVLALGAELRCGSAVASAADLSLLAAQFDAVLLTVGSEAAQLALGLETTPRGLKVDEHHRTSMAKVFAAGAAAGVGGRMAVRAGADALAAVEAIDAVLAGRELPQVGRPWSCRMGQAVPVALQSEQGQDAHATAGQGAAVAVEAARCLHCDCRKAGDHFDRSQWPCKLRYWASMYGAAAKSHGGPRRELCVDDTHELVVYDSGKCISCGLCVQITQRSGEQYGLTFVGRGFDVRVAVPFGRSLQEGLRKCAAEVAAACPVGAISLRE